MDRAEKFSPFPNSAQFSLLFASCSCLLFFTFPPRVLGTLESVILTNWFPEPLPSEHCLRIGVFFIRSVSHSPKTKCGGKSLIHRLTYAMRMLTDLFLLPNQTAGSGTRRTICAYLKINANLQQSIVVNIIKMSICPSF